MLIASATALTDRNGQTVRIGDVTRTTTAGIVLKSAMIAIVSRCRCCVPRIGSRSIALPPGTLCAGASSDRVVAFW